MKKITIAVDAMGGDHGLSVIMPACLQVLTSHPHVSLILTGDEKDLQKALTTYRAASHPAITIQHASQRVEMDESPSVALRGKKDSSMRVAINLVKEGRADACVSAGNTGALMAIARFVLKTIPGIDRPAIISTFPTLTNKPIRLLDLGANVDSTPLHLFQFAIMGSVLVSAIDNVPAPKVFLLNIGHEDIKGNELVKESAELFTQSKAFHYCGYIEANQIYEGLADVVVCDGFVGNVALKASEGIAIFIGKLLKESFHRTWLTKLAGFLAQPVLKSVVKRMDPDRYNGACFLGLQKTVIKSHGGANVAAYTNAIVEAIIQVEKNIPERISAEIEKLLKL